jgi:hypothetical protein
MTKGTARYAALFAALILSACQTYVSQPQPQRTAMDGRWASTDGVFIAEFDRGSFTSRFTQTGEVLAQGTYSVAGDAVSLRWISVQAQAERSATCTFSDAATVQCQQVGGGAFELRRSA